MFTRRSLLRSGLLAAPALILPKAASAMQIALPWRNPLAYPAGCAPGFDPSHVAAKNIKFSGISQGANFVGIAPTVQVCTLTIPPTSAVLGAIGPCTNFSGTQVIACNASLTNLTKVTFAQIFQTSGSGAIFQDTDDGTGFGLSSGIDTNLFHFIKQGHSSQSLGITHVPNTPYFFAVSTDETLQTLTAVVANLRTGQIQTSITTNTVAATTQHAGSCIGNNNLTSGAWPVGNLAAMMFSQTALNLNQLIAWAADPWSFWYPQTANIMAELVGSAPPAFQGLPLLGAGK